MQSLGITVRNLEAELVLHGHDNFDVIERVQAQIIYKMRISRELQGGQRGLGSVTMDMEILTSLYLGRIDLVVEFQDEQDTFCDQLLGQRLLVRVESNAVVVDLQGREDTLWA